MKLVTIIGKRNVIIIVSCAVALLLITFLGGYFAGKGSRTIVEREKYKKVFVTEAPKNEKFQKWREDTTCPNYTKGCPASMQPKSKQTLILISLDGFKAEYLKRKKTPAIQRLIDCGVHAPYMRSVYPTKTFPNHYSIVTGLYTENHRIVDNVFYSPKRNETFSLGNKKISKNPVWWGGEPFWITTRRQNLTSATYFWPGSDVKIDGMYPNLFKTYDKKVPFESRIDSILGWLNLPPEKKPDFITLYFSQPDGSGHFYGPNSAQVNNSLKVVDSMIDRLMQGIHEKNMEGCVNVIIVADHGMAATPSSQQIDLSNYVTLDPSKTFLRTGAVGQIRTKGPKDEASKIDEKIIQNLTCKSPHMRVYKRGESPIRFHYSDDDNISPILLDVDSGYSIKSRFQVKGNHGFDNIDRDMRAIFVAHGPAFEQKMTIDPFQNIELYNLFSQILGIKPASNNGTLESLIHILNKKPKLSNNPTPSFQDYAGNPIKTDKTGCKCSKKDSTKWNARFTKFVEKKQKESLIEKHDPFGISFPEKNYQRLINNDFITIFDMYPHLVTFTLSKIAKIQAKDNCWRYDVRLGDKSPKCSEYEKQFFVENNITIGPLFDQIFSSSNESSPDAWTSSNSIPVYRKYKDESVLPSFNELLKKLVNKFKNLNVVHGPIYKYGKKDLRNKDTTIRSHHNVPSHFFYVLTACKKIDNPLKDCTEENLETFAFILPHEEVIDNCQDFTAWFHRNSVRIRDVEKLSGIQFFTKFPSDVSARIRVRLPTIELWN